jgi:hypothetical protein
MWLSEERIRHISHMIVDAIYYDDLADYDDGEAVAAEVKKILLTYSREEDNIDHFVKNKIKSLSRAVPYGSGEWDILYKKYYEEEMKKKGR